jgi:DNA-directed RNA polymerase specialized sigma24 family protein
VDRKQPTADSFDPKKLSDKELIQRFCPEGNDQALADELWRRYQPPIYQALEKYSRTLCPAFYDPRDLLHDSYLLAPQNLCARICGFDELDSTRSLRAWLTRVACSTVLDERRKVTHSRIKEKIVELSIDKPSGEEHDEEKPRGPTEETLLELPELAIRRKAGTVSFSEPFAPRSHYVYFRSRYSTSPLDPSAPVEWGIIDQQRKIIFREILTRHDERSDEAATCAAMIRLRYWRKWPVARLVERFYGKPGNEQERAARHKAYYRLLDKNYEAITATLRRTFGIVRPEQI